MTLYVRVLRIYWILFQIFSEADLDEDDTLSFAEFEHVISKAPDFMKYVSVISNRLMFNEYYKCLAGLAL